MALIAGFGRGKLTRLRPLRTTFRFILLFASVAGVVVALGGLGAASGSSAPCSAVPTEPSLELIYRLEAGTKRVTPSTRLAAMGIVCKRLQTILNADGQVQVLTRKRIRVVLSNARDTRHARRAAEQISGGGRLYFYDWESSLIGPERKIGGHPGKVPPTAALRKANREWRAADRGTGQSTNAQLISAGAFPNSYNAVRLASEQKSRKRCAACSASTPRFYMFDRSPTHKLIAGPFSGKAELRNAVGLPRRHNDIGAQGSRGHDDRLRTPEQPHRRNPHDSRTRLVCVEGPSGTEWS